MNPVATSTTDTLEAAMLARRVMELLDAQNVKYDIVPHVTAYTALEIASRSHVERQELAKTVIVNLDGKLAMAVVPASHHVDIEALRVATGAERARIATESDFKKRFPDCELGAMPPFGNLYGMAVFADATLGRDREIAFNACSHEELVRISYADFVNLVNPRVISFAAPGAQPVYLDDRLW